MGPGLVAAVFVLAAATSLGTSWVLVSRLERVGERLGFSEGVLGLVAALAADTPEITSAVTALIHHQEAVGTGVVIGSNVFNLAALLGLGAVVAGRIGLHRRVVILGGAVAVWVAADCLLAVVGVIAPVVGLVLALAVLVPYAVVLGERHQRLARLGLPAGWVRWLDRAVAEEELELHVAIRPRRGTPADVVVGGVALAVVLVASIAMERAASSLGRHYEVAGIVVGALVLAVVTSLPNAVAAVYLAGRGRGAATWSTALNSNNLNVAVGLLLPATFIGLARPSAGEILITGWYGGLTLLTLALAYAAWGLRPWRWVDHHRRLRRLRGRPARRHLRSARRTADAGRSRGSVNAQPPGGAAVGRPFSARCPRARGRDGLR